MNQNNMPEMPEVINLDSSDDDEPTGETLHTADNIVVRRYNGVTTHAVAIVNGPPKVQRRHARSQHGHVYDPSGSDKRRFKAAVADMKVRAGVGGDPYEYQISLEKKWTTGTNQ